MDLLPFQQLPNGLGVIGVNVGTKPEYGKAILRDKRILHRINRVWVRKDAEVRHQGQPSRRDLHAWGINTPAQRYGGCYIDPARTNRGRRIAFPESGRCPPWEYLVGATIPPHGYPYQTPPV